MGHTSFVLVKQRNQYCPIQITNRIYQFGFLANSSLSDSLISKNEMLIELD